MDISLVKSLTNDPGVYLMKNKHGDIIYVGKAKNLKKRVISYFSKTKKTQKTQLLVKEIRSLDTIITSSEQEALLLEINLIKKHRPKYNIRLKNNSNGYPYLAYSKKSKFPCFEIKYNNVNHDFEYFGPYPQKNLAYQLCRNLNYSLKLRTCSESEFNRRKTPCLLYQLGRCSAPCVGYIDQLNYMKMFNVGLDILKGNNIDLFLEEKTKEMNNFADSENFEQALKVRDFLKAIDQLIQKQSVIDSNATDSKYYINLSREGDFYYVGLSFFNNGKMESLETYSFDDYDHEEDSQKYLEEFIVNYFAAKGHLENIQVVIPESISDISKELNLDIVIAETNIDKNILDLIVKNLSRADKEIDDLVLSSIKDEFNLENIPKKIECYDISHFQGTQVVGSKTCLINGIVAKDYYRKYKLSVDKNDDFNNLKEVLTRRFNDKKDEFPDLIIIDGGTPQLNKIKKLFEDLNIQGVDLVALAKEKITNSFEDKEITKQDERIITSDGQVIILFPNTLAFRLFTTIRNEAHRFAIKYHRELRKKVFFNKD